MTFLSGVLVSVLEWIIVKLVNIGIVEIESIIAKAKIASQASTDANALKKSTTEDEQKAAANTIISDTFK